MTAVEPVLYDPFVTLDDPYPTYQQLRDEHPLYYCAHRDLWVLSRFADVEAALRDPSTFSSANGISLIEPRGSMVPLLLTMDPPRHDELRRLVSRAFTPRRVVDLEPRIRALAVRLVTELTDDVMDFAAAFPAMVIAELLGVPSGDHARFRHWVESTITIDPAEMATAARAPGLIELFAYLQAIIDERRVERRDDMISALLDAEELSDAEILGFSLLLLAAGFETTKNLIGNGVDVLDRYPDARRGPIPAFVEEVLRYESPISLLTRTTTRDVKLHGDAIPSGARVVLLYGSANRDERAFADAGTFDPSRTEDRHLAFGHGIHYCLGAALARLEARIAFELLPPLEVVGSERLQTPYIRGFSRLAICS